jgi:signal transduction histidine kinase
VHTYSINSIEADVAAIGRIPIVGKILEVVCRTTGMGFAAIARVTEDKWVACSVLDEIDFGLKPGGELKIETTICHEIRQNGQAVVIDHVAEDLEFCDHHTPAMYGFQSYISVPIIRKNGSFFGTLCAIDPRPAKVRTPEVIGMFVLFADLISFHLEAAENLTHSENSLVEERKTTAWQNRYNQELTIANKKLIAANEQLALTQRNLQQVVSELTESKEKLRQAIETGKMGTWSINPFSYEVTLSLFVRTLLGFPTEGEVTMDEILEVIDAEYHDALGEILLNAVKNHQSSDIEYSIVNCITQERKWVRVTGRVFFDAEGNPTEYSGIMMDITERKLDDLRKNDFIGMVSHELKTPLTSLNAYVQMLYKKATQSEDHFTAGALGKAATQIKKMSVMINGFLNVSRLESGKILLQKQPFILDELVKEMVEDAVLVSSSHIITMLPSQPFLVNADRDKIGNVISNLLSNAIKYSPKGKLITVKCEIVKGNVQVSIQDEGMGIKPQHLEKLFNRFYRIDSKHTQNISGFGIGLYLCAEIVQSHKGKIWVDSKIGVGSSFQFSLPLPV